MPSLSGNNKIIFNETDFLACLNTQYVTSTSAVPGAKMTNKLATAQGFNPYRYLGYAAPGYEAADVTNEGDVNDKILNGVIGYESSTAYAYMVTLGNEFHQMSLGSSPSVSNTGVWPHSITGTGAITGSDVINYNIDGSNYIFYSWKDSSAAWNVGKYDLDGTTFDDDWFTTVPTTGTFTTTGNLAPHPMVIGDDDILYIGDANKLHAYDGPNDTVSQAVLTLPSGYRITSFAKTGIYLVVFAYYDQRNSVLSSSTVLSTSKAFFWNMLDLDPDSVIDLDDNLVSEAFNHRGTIGCFTQGTRTSFDAQRLSRLKIFDGQTFNTVQEFIGNAPLHGGVSVVGDVIQWNSDGLMHQYGSPFEGMPIGLNKLTQGTSTGSSTSSGMCKTFDADGIYMSDYTGSVQGIKRYKTNFISSANFTTSLAEPLFPEGKTGQVKSVTVAFAKTASGGRSLALYLKSNTGLVQFISGLIAITSSELVQKFESPISGSEWGKFDELALVAAWTTGQGETDAPVIKRVIVEYQTINIEAT